jgi:hypothetical protein
LAAASPDYDASGIRKLQFRGLVVAGVIVQQAELLRVTIELIER